MHELPKTHINLPGRHCPCGALRADNNQRCQKCQARSSWYRHNCRGPRRAASRTLRASTRTDAQAPASGQTMRRAEES
jgi:hypothetical protein